MQNICIPTRYIMCSYPKDCNGIGLGGCIVGSYMLVSIEIHAMHIIVV